MEEYEVRDVARRMEAPDLRLEVTCGLGSPFSLTFDDGAVVSTPVPFQFTIFNEAPEPANYVVFHVYIDARLSVANPAGLQRELGLQTFNVGSQTVQCHVLFENWGIPGKLPVWEGVRFSLTDAPLMLGFPAPANEIFYLGWGVHAPRMAIKRKFSLLVARDKLVRILSL